LSQEVNGEEHPVAFASRSLSKAERNYSTTRKELLAVGLGLKYFRCYLDKPFVLRTDHASLRWLWQSKEIYGQCAQWFEVLANFDFKLVHRQGVKHGNADALSRRPETGDKSLQEKNKSTDEFPLKVDNDYVTISVVTECLMPIDRRNE